ncbi:hypothetical protein RSA46_21130 [Pseudomonas oryzihabitans]|nr:hypothetical protein SB5_12420 [Pseudomonas psychrotolerans]KTT42501.1 hypothetical protein RSA46_21130 [Pseudomonas psychrotolerans]
MSQLSVQERGPASFGQEGLWVAQSIGRVGTSYQEVLALEVEGALDIQRLEQALDRVVQRHPSLRSCFVAGPLGLEQCVFSIGGIHLVAEPIAPEHLESWIAHQQQQPFNLSVAPLFRVRLALLGPAHHIVLVVIHHMIVDGWSLGVFERDLSEFYAEGPYADLPELSTSPIDYARSERERSRTPVWRQAQCFWAQYLAGIPRVAAQSGSRALTLSLHLDSEATQELLAIARQLKVSPFAVGFSAFAVAMSMLTERDDLVLATDFSGRTELTYEPVIGMFVNQVPVRWIMSHGLTGEIAIKQAQRLIREVLAHAHLPYSLIAQACQPAGGELFEGKFVLHNMPRHLLHLAGLEVQINVPQGAGPKFPVLVELWEQGGGLSGSVTIDPSRSRLTPQMLAHRFHSVLKSIVLTPQKSLEREGPIAAAPAFVPSRRRVDLSSDPVIIISSEVAPRPTLIQCSSADVDLKQWAHKESDVLEAHLKRSGALLFRGFGLNSSDMFEQAAKQLGGEPLPYVQRSTPRTEVKVGVYTSTEYPADQSIFFHCENAYATCWPERLFFFCEIPAAEGGRTPLADCRAVLKRLPEMIRKAFEHHGVIYRRRFRPGLGLSWQQVFAVDELDALERKYVPQGYRFSRGSHSELVADLAVPAMVTHPDTGEVAWFNHAALFHPAGLAEALGELAAGQDVSQLQAVETLLGDGSAIPAEWIAQIRRAYVASSFAFDWQQGDLLMLDNRLTAHGREPFTAPRRILVAMTREQRHQPLVKGV